MTSDLLENVFDIDDTSIGLIMEDDKCVASLSIIDTHGVIEFCLMPNEQGLENAEKIETALRNWREHVIKMKSTVSSHTI